jgi:hypothetical protein
MYLVEFENRLLVFVGSGKNYRRRPPFPLISL